ncbi:MAG: 3'-5' exonuclease [Nanoarchaeota archaeon]|nr:3'-5' exonuclease [Nanoarchaeota archaeon]
MIVVDIETSGVDFTKCGIWQIGAVDLDNLENIFFEEAYIDDEDEILNVEGIKGAKPVLEVIGKTEEELRDKNKQSQKEMLKKFFEWASKIKVNNCICQNPSFDLGFIFTKARKYGLRVSFHYRSFDLHTIAQMKHFEIGGKFSVNEEKERLSMGLSNILKFCGFLGDPREYHNALEDAKLTAECFSRLVDGKNLFPEFSKFEIPRYLKK